MNKYEEAFSEIMLQTFYDVDISKQYKLIKELVDRVTGKEVINKCNKCTDKDNLRSFIIKTEECKVDICIEGTDTYIEFTPEYYNYKVSMIYAIKENHLEVHIVKEEI